MNAAIQQRKSELASLAKDLQPLAEKSKGGGLTDEEGARFDDLVAQFNAAGEALTDAQNRYDAALEVTQKITGYGEFGASADGVSRDTLVDPAGHPLGAKPRFQTLGQRFAESAELKQSLKKSGARPTMDEPFVVDEPLVVRGAQGLMQSLSGLGPDEIRALIYSGTMSASALLPQVFPNVYRATEPPLVMRDVLLAMSTTSDNVTILQESGFTNNAAEVAEAIDATSGLKPESAITFTEATFPVRIVAHWIPVTRQNLEDLAWIRGYIDGRLLQGLARREDNQFLNGNGTPPNLTGIYNTSGILILDGTYFTGAPVTDAGQSNENINRIRRAKTRVALSTVGGATATFVVANPADVEAWDTASDSTRNYLVGGPMAGTVTRLWGLPVVQSEYTAAKTALVGDGTMAAVVDRSRGAIYTTDSHSDYFVRNIFVVLAEERVALVVFRPAAFAKVTLA